MISLLMYSHQSSGVCMATLIFYTCILIPLRQIKQNLLTVIVKSRGSRHDSVDDECCYDSKSTTRTWCQLPVARLQELHKDDDDGGINGTTTICCSICLADLEKEDIVSQLSRCKHVFHTDCIEKWVERDQFTCPLCRSIID